MTGPPSEVVAELRDGLAGFADADKAEGMAAYTKGRFVYLGVQAGDRRLVSKAVIKAAKSMDPDGLLDLSEALWSEPEREFHYIGMDLLRAGALNLRATDLGRIRGRIVATPWWDTVDSLARHSYDGTNGGHPSTTG